MAPIRLRAGFPAPGPKRWRTFTVRTGQLAGPPLRGCRFALSAYTVYSRSTFSQAIRQEYL